jgi:hypothetical protein
MASGWRPGLLSRASASRSALVRRYPQPHNETGRQWSPSDQPLDSLAPLRAPVAQLAEQPPLKRTGRAFESRRGRPGRIVKVLDDLFGPGTWGTGGNLVAWVICGALGVGGAWLFRDKIGRNFARWFHKHHQPHLRRELDQLEERIRRHLDDINKP